MPPRGTAVGALPGAGLGLDVADNGAFAVPCGAGTRASNICASGVADVGLLNDIDGAPFTTLVLSFFAGSCALDFACFPVF